MTLTLRLATGIPIILGLSVAEWQAGRVIRSDWLTRQGTPESFKRLLAFAPENGDAQRALALFLTTDPAAAKAHFNEAIKHNPRDSRSLIELALLLENDGEYPTAEKLLLEAARVDALYFPRWSLANFFLRRGDYPNFWKWARNAADMSFGSMASLYRLAAHVAGDSQSVVSLLDLHKPATLEDYLEFAISAGRLEEVKEVIRKLAPRADTSAILRGCTALIQAGRTGEAASLCPTSAEFRRPPVDAAFEWRLPRVDGIETIFSAKDLRLHISARQPERCELLWRYLPLSGPGQVIISASLYTSGLPRDSGLYWQLFDTVTGGDAGRQHDWLYAVGWTAIRVPVSIPNETKGLRLALVYERAPGTVRSEGDLYLKDVQVSGGRP